MPFWNGSGTVAYDSLCTTVKDHSARVLLERRITYYIPNLNVRCDLVADKFMHSFKSSRDVQHTAALDI